MIVLMGPLLLDIVTTVPDPTLTSKEIGPLDVWASKEVKAKIGEFPVMAPLLVCKLQIMKFAGNKCYLTVLAETTPVRISPLLVVHETEPAEIPFCD